MSQLAVDGFRAEREAILTLAKGISADEWLLPSACAGWSIRDVMGHMACTLHGVLDPTFLPDTTQGTERGMEPSVTERRTWPIEQVIDEYETYSGQAADVFASLQSAPLSETMIPMADLGTHPMAILPSTFLFDGYTHLRNDILTPNGSIDRPEPPRDEMRLRPTIEWMLAGLPWMCADALRDIVDRPIVLALDGPGGGTWTIGPGGDEGRVTVAEGTDAGAAASITSTDHDFVIWGTRRAPWRESVKVVGDDAYAARVLDAIKII
jgi:uncharacterized protein (TIGR03083 family)